MMQILAVKTFLKKSWVWTKNYWYVPVGFFWMVITWFFFRQKAETMLGNFKETQKAHKKEIDLINKSKEEEVKGINRKVDEHLKKDKESEERYRESSKKIKERSVVRKIELAKKENEELAEELRKMIERRKE
tara:strand:+ start:2690 stop:3085 length:396 start_codon:yes stop_codon:yes gene_type:complete